MQVRVLLVVLKDRGALLPRRRCKSIGQKKRLDSSERRALGEMSGIGDRTGFEHRLLVLRPRGVGSSPTLSSINIGEKKMKRLIIGWWIVSGMLSIGFIYIALHFIRKFW